MLRTLIKSRFRAMFSTFSGKKKKRKLNLFLMILLGIYVVGVFFLLFGMMFYALAEPLKEMNLEWMYFALAGVMSFLFCFIGSVFFVKTQMFESTDNELLLSMPIPPSAILSSRVISILLVNYIYELFIYLPAVVMYTINVGFNSGVILSFTVVSLLLPLLTMAFTCLAGWLVALITQRMPMKNLMTLVLTMGFMVAYVWVFNQIPEYILTLANRGEEIAEILKKAVFPAYYFGIGSMGDIGAIGIFFLCAIVPFGVVYLVLSKSFIYLVTTKHGRAKAKYREKRQRRRSVMVSLIWKENARIFSNAMYMLNVCLASLFLLIGPVIAAVQWTKVEEYLTVLPTDITRLVGSCIGILLCAVLSMNLISAPSVSTEGKNLWLCRSMPVKESTILFAKVWTHVLLSAVPAFFAGAVFVVLLRPSAVDTALAFILPAVYATVCGEIGVLINLRFPRFDYVNDVAAAKQSLSSFVSMFINMGVIAVPIIAYIYLLTDHLDVIAAELIYAAVLAVVAAGLAALIRGWGAKRLRAFN